MKNITLKLEDSVLDRVKHVAVDEDTSVSRWVQQVITRELEARDSYEQSRRKALMVLRDPPHLDGRVLTRDEMHER